MTWRCKLVLAVHLGIVGGLIVNHADAAVTTATHTSWALRSGTSQLATFATQAACEEEARKRPQDEGVTRTTGSRVYTCVTSYNVIATFRPNPTQPVPCQAAPAPRTQACPQGFTGSWQQIASVGPAPACTITWSPMTAPASACTPVVVDPPRTATLTWIPPTRNTDGSPLTNLAGYRVQYGLSANAMASVVQIANAAATRHTIQNLTPGTWYFNVRSYATSGAESEPTATISKTIR